MGVGVSLVVALLVLPPMGAVVLAGAGSGFAPLRHPDVVLNTLLFGLLTTLCAMLLGGGLALSLAPGVPGRVLLERLVVMPLYLTPLLTAMGWSWLASPRSGLLNLLLHAAFSARVTINVVSAAGAIVVTALAAAPLPFLLLSDALRALDPALLEAARVHGAMPRLVFRRIVLPLLLPAALASAVLVFVQAIGMFSVPAVLGMPAGFNVATTEIYQLLESYPPRTADATAWGILLLAITALLTFAQAAVLGRRSFVTITGKAFRPNQHPPRARRLRAGVAWLLRGAGNGSAADRPPLGGEQCLHHCRHQADALHLTALRLCAARLSEDLARRRQLRTTRHPDREPGLLARPGGELDRAANAPSRPQPAGPAQHGAPQHAGDGVRARTAMGLRPGAAADLRHHRHSADRLRDPLPAVRRARHQRGAASVASGTRGSRARRRRILAAHHAQDHPAAGAARHARRLGAAVRDVDAGGELLDPALHQPQHRAVGRRVRPVGERQPERRGRTGLPPAYRQLRHRRGVLGMRQRRGFA